jgi:hypothetical protein
MHDSGMKLLPRLVIVLVVCLIAIALPAVPAQAACVPYDIELSPKSGVPGTELTVYGHDFTAGKLVDIYYDGTRSATNRTDANGEFTLTFTIPKGCTGQYQVLADLGYTTVDTYFTVRPGLMVSPEEGPAGTNVTVKGRGFAKNEQGIDLNYYLNGNYETVDRHILANTEGSWEMSFPIPPSTRGEHKLDAEGDESRLYEVEGAIFKVTAEISIDKPSGIVGDSVTMRGSAFTAYEKGIQILFDGETALTGINADGQGYWEESFKVPEMPSGTYNVTAGGAMTPREDTVALRFEIKPGIVLPPGEGHVGMNLTVTGHGFAASTDVIIMYDGSQKATATTNGKGSFGVSFPVPESKYGEHQVTAGYAGENHANAILTVESDPPPTPALISPSKGSWLGFTGSARPTFRWSAVSDESGVRYRLQIANGGNITATGEFVDPVVSVVGLVGTNYTLQETEEALPAGTYYWIVQAVDGAENESAWSKAYSFRVGLLPKWALITSIVAIVVLMGTLIRALVIRKRYYY